MKFACVCVCVCVCARARALVRKQSNQKRILSLRLELVKEGGCGFHKPFNGFRNSDLPFKQSIVGIEFEMRVVPVPVAVRCRP
jgi:hypothetical protein